MRWQKYVDTVVAGAMLRGCLDVAANSQPGHTRLLSRSPTRTFSRFCTRELSTLSLDSRYHSRLQSVHKVSPFIVNEF